jgi:hypothetical protein
MSPLLEYTRARFRDALGEACVDQDDDRHWSFWPRNRDGKVGGPPIFVLVADHRVRAAVWVFDPLGADGGVHRAPINLQRHADEAVEEVLRRLRRAVQR